MRYIFSGLLCMYQSDVFLHQLLLVVATTGVTLLMDSPVSSGSLISRLFGMIF